MYINLPSKNRYRRPANYISRGYRSRRMAVDFAIPLITDVKCAKLLTEALVRRMPLDVSTVDSKSSHETYTLPGLINVASFVTDLTSFKSSDVGILSKASLGAGFTTALILPVGEQGNIEDSVTLERAHANARGVSHTNYAFSVAASVNNVNSLDEEVQADVKYLFIPYRRQKAPLPVSVVAAHFASWPKEKLIVTDAEGSDLASVLLLASLHSRNLHVTGVRSKDDLLLISLSKARNLQVTCDVAVYTLFFVKEQYPSSNALPSSEHQRGIWANLDVVDALSVGVTPYELSLETQGRSLSSAGLEETLPLLLGAVSDGRLTLDDITKRLHDNPVKIFGLPDQAHTHVEVTVGRTSSFQASDRSWSPLDGQRISGVIHRVVVHGQNVFLDGSWLVSPMGRDVSGATISHPKTERSGSITGATRPDILSPPTKSVEGHGFVPSLSLTSMGAAPSTVAAPPHFVPLQPHPTFHRRHILSVKQFTQRDLYDLFAIAHEMRLQVERNGTLDILKGKVLCTLFYEASTRTSASFDAAMKRCGGEVIQVNATHSSVVKGETLEDTIRTLGCYVDAVVIRHPAVGSAQTAAKFSPVPVLNAGDGIGEHPTQVGTQHSRPKTMRADVIYRHSWMFTPSGLSLERSMDVLSRSSVTSRTAARFTAWSPCCAYTRYASTSSRLHRFPCRRVS